MNNQPGQNEVYTRFCDMPQWHLQIEASPFHPAQRYSFCLPFLSQAGPDFCTNSVCHFSQRVAFGLGPRFSMTSHIPQPKTGFRLPPDVSFEKQRLPDAWAYVFRHRALGELRRILLQELDDGRCHISCEKRRDRSTRRHALRKQRK